MAGSEDNAVYQVVINDEEQFSVWPVEREIPLGWRAVGMRGSKAECEAYVAREHAEDAEQEARINDQYDGAGE